MAITTDSYYDVIYNEETVDRIGLSKTLDNYTIEEIAAMTYCGTEFSMVKNISEREQGVNLFAWDLAKPFVAEDGEHIGNGGKYILSPGNSDYQFPNGMPFNVVWIAFDYSYAPPQNLNNHEGMAEHCKIITEFDAPKYVFEMQQPVQRGGIGATSWDTADAPLYDTGLYLNDNNGNLLKYQISDNVFTSAINPCGGCVAPYMFANLNGTTILVLLCSYNNQWYSRGNGTGSPWVPDGEWTGGGSYINYNWETSFGSSCNVASLSKNSFNGEAIEFPYTWYYSEGYWSEDWGTPLDCFGYNDLGEPIEVYFRGVPDDGMGSERGFTLRTYCKNRDQIYKLIAGGGIKFKTDKIYKPIIEGGWVTGYTDDMSTPSELDEWHGSTVHTVTPTPPSPGPTPESFDSDPSAYNDAYTTGVPSSQLYAMTLAQVNDMFSKLTNGGIIPANFEPGNAVISIQRYPFSLSSFASAVESNITWTARPDVIGPETPTRIMFPPTGEEIKGYPIYNPVKRVSLGSFKLSEFWTNYIAFLNREISASLYIPFCGIIEIDINAILNKTITVYLTIDVISGGCTAAVDINGCMYTTVSGSCSADMYFSTSNYGTIRAALRSNTAEQVYNAAQIAAGAIGAAASGNWAGWGTQAATGAIFNTVGKAIKRTMMRNGVTPSVHGSAGDMSGWKLPMHCQLILSLPRPNHSSDSIYGHSHGYLTVTEKTVGSCSGLTVCDNPDVSNIGTATDTEKEMIYNMLQNGVYV